MPGSIGGVTVTSDNWPTAGIDGGTKSEVVGETMQRMGEGTVNATARKFARRNSRSGFAWPRPTTLVTA